MSIYIGDGVTLRAKFYKSDVLTNPSTVTLTLIDPSANSSSETPSNESTGVYAHEVVVDEVGVWKFKFAGAGTVTKSESGGFTVTASAV